MSEEDMITLDGSEGEGGGQILRSALSLSLVTGTGFRIVNVRAGRQKPGLLRQHLTAVKAATEVGDADVEGAELGSRELVFQPRGVRAGAYRFSVGTAGSATLVLQTVLPALLCAKGASTLSLEGGTHNPMAPPFDFIERVWLPVVNRMGPRVECSIERAGYFPAGGGRFTVTVEPVAKLAAVELMARGEVREKRVLARVAGLAGAIAKRELLAANEVLGWSEASLRIEQQPREWGPGNVVLVEVVCEGATEMFAAFGERGRSAEAVGRAAAQEALSWMTADVPVGEMLADQLLLPMAMAGGGRFATVEPSSHTVTNARVVERFLPVTITWEKRSERAWEVSVRGR